MVLVCKRRRLSEQLQFLKNSHWQRIPPESFFFSLRNKPKQICRMPFFEDFMIFITHFPDSEEFCLRAVEACSQCSLAAAGGAASRQSAKTAAMLALRCRAAALPSAQLSRLFSSASSSSALSSGASHLTWTLSEVLRNARVA
jgi:hypothetical protein